MTIVESYNFAVGPGAGNWLTTGTHNLLIGPQAGADLVDEHYQLRVTDWEMAEPYLVYIVLHLLEHGAFSFSQGEAG